MALAGLRRALLPAPVLVAASTFPATNLAFRPRASDLVLSDTDPVASWTDISGNGRHFTESTNKPAYRTNKINGKAAVVFDGSNDVLTLSSPPTGFTACTLWMVLNVVSYPGTSGLFSAALATGQDYDSEDGLSYYLDSGTPRLALSRTPSGTADGLFLTTSAFSAGTYRHVMAILDGAGNATMYVNGTSVGTDTYSDTNPIDPTIMGLGCRIASGIPYGYGNIELAEVAFWTQALGSSDRALVNSYATSEYAL